MQICVMVVWSPFSLSLSHTCTHSFIWYIQGMLLSYSIGTLLRTLLSLHFYLQKPMTRASALATCRLIELLKCVQYTFHRRALDVAGYVVLIMNQYEILLLQQIQGHSVRHFQCVCVCVCVCTAKKLLIE